MSLKDGLERIWMVRPIAEPNKGFMTQLGEYEELKLGKKSNVSILEKRFEQLKEQAIKYKKNARNMRDEKEV